MTTASQSAVPRRLRVVIADDSAAIRTSLSALVTRLRDVEIAGVAHDGREALALIRALRPDVVTLDVRMPEMTGINVLETLQREGLKPLRIVLTGMPDGEYRQRCLELGASHFFNKATEFEKVIEILAHEARRLNPPDPGAASPKSA